MSANEFELLRCDDCGKTLGYVRLWVKTFPPKWLYRAWYGFPYQKIEKSAFCEECFQKRKARTS